MYTPSRAVHGLPPNTRFAHSPKVELSVEDPTTREMLLRSLEDLGAAAYVAALIWLLTTFLGSVLDRDPFGASNIRRLRSAGALLLLGAPLLAFIESALRTALFDDVAKHTSGLSSDAFSLPGWA